MGLGLLVFRRADGKSEFYETKPRSPLASTTRCEMKAKKAKLKPVYRWPGELFPASIAILGKLPKAGLKNGHFLSTVKGTASAAQ